MDRASVIGLVLGIAAVVGGTLFEGGKIASIMQPTAALIVFGGTAGATFLSYSFRDILKAIAALAAVVRDRGPDPDDYIDEILRYSNIARKNGLVALDLEIQRIEDDYLRKAMTFAVDRLSPRTIRETMEQENITFELQQRRVARVFETAGGFAPTIGILGAVLGLIQVMENLSDPAKLGAGIAVAFVATIYGVGSANLILIPISKKLVLRMQRDLSVREMIIEGVIGIQSGANPHYLRERLKVHFEETISRPGRG